MVVGVVVIGLVAIGVIGAVAGKDDSEEKAGNLNSFCAGWTSKRDVIEAGAPMIGDATSADREAAIAAIDSLLPSAPSEFRPSYGTAESPVAINFKSDLDLGFTQCTSLMAEEGSC